MNSKNILKGDLIKYYINRKLSVHEIAKILGCNYITIIKNLKKFGIPIRCVGNGFSKEIPKNVLQEYYIDQNLTTKVCAQKLGCTITTIRKYLKKYSIPLRAYIKSFSKETLEELYINQKLSIVQIGESFNCDPTTVLNYLKKFNIQIRPLNKINLGRKHSKEFCQGISKRHKGKVVSNETKIKIGNANRGHVVSDKQKKEISEIVKQLWKNTEYAAKQRKKRQENWKNPEYVQKIMCARNLSPNKPESLILSILNEYYSNEWKYTGNFSFTISGKNPDFTNFNTNQVIDYFGDYYHKDSNEQFKRQEHFVNNGYESLIIWESEISCLDDLTYRIKRFCNFGELTTH